MKKSLLALALLGAFAGTAAAQTNVTVYGIVDAGIYHADNGVDTKTGLGSGMQSGSRIGFRGTEDLGGGLSAIFQLENGFTIDDGAFAQSKTTGETRLFGRQAWVGLSFKDVGALKFGRQNHPLRAAVESIDPFAIGLAGNAFNVFEKYDERADNTVNFTSANFGGFVGQAAYSFGEVAGDSSAARQLGLSGAYSNGPISAVLAYHKVNGGGTTAPANFALDAKKDTVFLGATYNFDVAKLHAAYAINKGENAAGADDIDNKDWMLGASVPFGASTFLVSYINHSDDLPANSDVKQWALGYTYALSKRTNFYASYAKIKNEGGATKNFGSSIGLNPAAGDNVSVFNVGIKHTF